MCIRVTNSRVRLGNGHWQNLTACGHGAMAQCREQEEALVQSAVGFSRDRRIYGCNQTASRHARWRVMNVETPLATDLCRILRS